MRNGRYRKYMLREVTCLLVGFYSFFTICALSILAGGSAEAWNSFLASQQNGFWISFHAVALIFFLVYMTFDWFKLAPKALPLQLGEQKAPDIYIVVVHYVAWIVVSATVFWLAGVI
jgi:fumarate reductase subunit C